MYLNRRTGVHQQRRIGRHVSNSDAYEFFNLLTSPDLLDQVEAQLPEHRERLFPPTETLSMFLAQALSADRSCQQAVNAAAIKRLTQGMAVCSTHTGAYCRARQRLPLEMVGTLARHTGQLVAQRSPAGVALAGSGSAVGGWHNGVDARYPGQPIGLSTITDSKAWFGFSAVSHGGYLVSWQRRAPQCRPWSVPGQGQ